jgi:NTE family protein
MDKMQAERAQAVHLAWKQAEKQAAEAQHLACLDNRSRLQKLARIAGLNGTPFKVFVPPRP